MPERELELCDRVSPVDIPAMDAGDAPCTPMV